LFPVSVARLYCLTPAHNIEFWKLQKEPVRVLLVGRSVRGGN